MSNLIIVESPAKSRTIERFLGKNYKVLASYGHVRDLPKTELGVDTEDNFKPHYLVMPKSRKVISLLKEEISKSPQVFLATDLDREGEAIAWHIIQAVGLEGQRSKVKGQKFRRITFHEITQKALSEALKKPREIDMKLVDSQQARRILDRLVGYKLSPLLWEKVAGGLSAGRVQSVAVRLIVDLEREIEKFKTEEYWEVEALLSLQNVQNSDFKAKMIELNSKKLAKLDIKSEKQAKEIVSKLEKATYTVKKVEQKTENKYPFPPYTTSTLQQDAAHKLHFSAKKTMKLAQDLYERGKITYMRTDSTSLSWLAITSARKIILDTLGKEYLPEKPRIYKTRSKLAQEAHEAIHPVYLATKADNLSSDKGFTADHLKLYDLIWRRMLACQMSEAVLEIIDVNIEASVPASKMTAIFKARGQSLKFEGFLKVYPMEIEQITIPSLRVSQVLKLIKLLETQHFTKPSARYTEATLIKDLEKHGIGRPSTYAPTVSTILERGYVRLQNHHFYPTEIGEIVSDLLVEHFPQIVDIDFTAKMEEDLDKIAEGKENMVKVLREFYQPFSKVLNEKEKEIKKEDITGEVSEKCPKDGGQLKIRISKYGKFLGCSNFPKCRYTRPLVNHLNITCPKCQKGEVVEKKTRRFKVFYGCSRYPKCDFASWEKPNVSTAVNSKSD